MREHSWQCGSIRAPRAIGASAVSAARVAPSQVVGARYQECPAPGAEPAAGHGWRETALPHSSGVRSWPRRPGSSRAADSPMMSPLRSVA